jgi:hypothetical protein
MASEDTKLYKNKGFGGKIIFVGKLIVFLVTFGFAFPLLMSE